MQLIAKSEASNNISRRGSGRLGNLAPEEVFVAHLAGEVLSTTSARRGMACAAPESPTTSQVRPAIEV